MSQGKPPKYSGGFGYGPWPDTDVPFDDNPGGDYYSDGWCNRAPAGTHHENPTDYWLDCMTYPDRPRPMNTAAADEMDKDSRAIQISVGNATGWGHGPTERPRGK